MSDRPPNFLVFIADQMRADHLGCDGNPVIETPALDGLAESGVRFSRAYVNCPLCMPSRSTLFTGLTPRGHQVRTNGIPLSASFPTVPQALATAGYETASFGKIHLTNYGRNAGVAVEQMPPERFPELFEHWRTGRIAAVPTPYYGLEHVDLTIGHGPHVDAQYARWLEEEHPADWERLQAVRAEPSPGGAPECGTYALPEELHHTQYVADRTIAWLRRRASGTPFFAICSFPDPHHPYTPPRPWDRKYAPEDVVAPCGRAGELDDLPPHFRRIHESRVQLSGRELPTNMPEAHRREIIAHTYGMVSLIDRHVGRVLGVLDELGLAGDTVVLFISDHGDMLGDHGLLNKGPFHFEGVLRVPMIWRWPRRFVARSAPALASLLDVAPTILDVAGVAIPEGPTSPEAPRQPPAWPGRSLAPVLMGEAESVQDSVVVENDEDYLGLRLRTLITPGYKLTTYTDHRGPAPYGELFDLTQDPDELHNRWADPAYRAVRGTIIEQLHHRLTETDIAVPRRLSHA